MRELLGDNHQQDEREAADTGWFKALRSPEALELIAANPNAFVLLYVIAYRARRTDLFNRHNLRPGQALIGDYIQCGMSERQYRTAKEHLSKWKFATFTATNKGTVATLMNTRVFDINLELSDGQTDGQATNDRRASDERPTTNKNVKKEKNEKEGQETPPIFEPLKRGLYRREYESMLTHAQGELRKLKMNEASYTRVLAKDVEEACECLMAQALQEPERRRELIQKCQRRQNNPANYVRGELTADASRQADAWKQRIGDIQREMNGLTRAPFDDGHRANVNGRPRTDRNQGTTNDGNADQYEGVGIVGEVPDVQTPDRNDGRNAETTKDLEAESESDHQPPHLPKKKAADYIEELRKAVNDAPNPTTRRYQRTLKGEQP